MKRHIITDYDSRNDCWYITYIKEYADTMYVQSFRTPLFTSETNQNRCKPKDCLAGIKRKIHEAWLGKGFIDRLWSIYN